MAAPRDVIAAQPAGAPAASPAEERFLGFGVMSCPFDSGHQLSLRSFRSSVGPAYSSVWHCDPAGAWTFYADATPELACTRYFGSAVQEAVVTPIELRWGGPSALTVTMPERGFSWELGCGTDVITRVMNTMGRAIPEALWWSPRFLGVMSRVAGVALRAGKLELAGRAPNGQWFRANPRLVWPIVSARARLGEAEFGQLARASRQRRLGDFWIPARPLLAAGEARFEAFDPARHSVGPASPPDGGRETATQP